VAGLGLVVASQVTELDPSTGQTAPVSADLSADLAAVDAGVKGAETAPAPEAVAPVVSVPEVSAPVSTVPDAPQDAMPLRDAANSSDKADLPPDMPESGAAPNQIVAPALVTSEVMGADGGGMVADVPTASPEAATSVETSLAPETGTAPEAPRGTDPAPSAMAMAASDAPAPAAADAAPETATPPAAVAAVQPPETALEDAQTADLPSEETGPVEIGPEETGPEDFGPNTTATTDAEPVGTDLPEPEVIIVEPVAPRPAPGFAGVDGVKTGRLPSISPTPEAGSDANTETIAETITRATDEATPEARTDLPPIDRFARKFENTAQKPLFVILLRDTGGPDIDRETLAAIPFPVSFIIDPAQPDAALAAQIYRAAGQEVLMLGTGIPAGATASDLAVSLEAMATILPEAVGIVDQENGGFQANRALASQVLAVIGDQGRGVISWDKGLNAASQVAQREGIRNAVIFRAMDGADEKSAVIRRYLDRAAFKAAQDGRVVVEGRTRPETVTALLEWAVEGRAATVVLAPATAVMTAQ
jgi:polysaccharide deacetylase 2 family uncharacterized protein YibQ